MHWMLVRFYEMGDIIFFVLPTNQRERINFITIKMAIDQIVDQLININHLEKATNQSTGYSRSTILKWQLTNLLVRGSTQTI